MPWWGTAPVEQGEGFIADHRASPLTMTELCRRRQPKTGYKWLRRHPEQGRPRLKTAAMPPTAWNR